MGKRTLWAIIVLLVLFGGSFIFGMLVYLASSSEGDTSIFGSGNVGLVRIEGTIVEPMDTLREIDEYRKDDDIKAVVVRIESPGGAVSASQELYTEIKKLSEKKPVVASMGSVAASGGYYAACGATKIVANPGTITGSIGVRLDHVNLGDLLRWAKIGHETLKSGRFKDIASPDRPMTEEEKRILEGLISELHGQFKKVVETSRGLSEEVVDLLADGRVYSGEDAQLKGLIDQQGDYFDAVKLAGELAGIKGEPKVVEKHKKGKKLLERFFEDAFASIRSALIKSEKTYNEPMLLYMTY